MSKQEDFVAAIAPAAQKVQSKYGVPASIAIAQAILETGYGKSVKGNNYFGIKSGSSWNGAKVDMATHEFLNGRNVALNDSFRAYGGVDESVENYGHFLATNSRYASVIGASSGHDAADALQRAGYATDPKYAAKLKAIINENNLTRFDDASYTGYTASDEAFNTQRKRLQEQRVANPAEWDDFLGFFMKIFAAIFSGMGSLFAGNPQKSDQTTVERPQVPEKHAAAKTPQLVRG